MCIRHLTKVTHCALPSCLSLSLAPLALLFPFPWRSPSIIHAKACNGMQWQEQCCGVQMYKATKQQEEQHTPAFVRMQQQAVAKEAEEAAEKKRIWEEEDLGRRGRLQEVLGKSCFTPLPT